MDDDEDFDWLLLLTCPECHRVGTLAGILWGMPSGPPVGNVIIGGCVDPNFDAKHGCTECGWEGEVDAAGHLVGPSRDDRVLGCLLGGALGDALGAPVEFWSSERIRQECQFQRLTDRFLPTTYGDELGLITDDTQMTLFTFETLLRCQQDSSLDPIRELHEAYLRWRGTQVLPEPPAGAAGLAAESWLYARRAPGNTCMSALDATATSGELGVPAVNNSKGCGGVMRSAPFGLFRFADPGWLAASAAALTHGHPTGQVSSGALAVVIDRIMAGFPLTEAIDSAVSWCDAVEGGEETAEALRRAIALAADRRYPDQETVESLGGAWVGEEALAIAVYCAVVFRRANETHLALESAVMHGGDSDSTGAICGNILGALHGAHALPELVRLVEGFDTINHLSTLSGS
jgi:ADP-ribosylglycohydrolase